MKIVEKLKKKWDKWKSFLHGNDPYKHAHVVFVSNCWRRSPTTGLHSMGKNFLFGLLGLGWGPSIGRAHDGLGITHVLLVCGNEGYLSNTGDWHQTFSLL